MEVEIDCPEKLGFFFNENWRYKVAYGGRGSAKSWTVADALICRAAERPQRILCAREFQRSIKDSVHHLLETQIERLGLSHMFRVHNTEIECTRTKSSFIFAGLHHNIASLKSLEAIDVCWVEEAEVVSDDSWSKLIPTIRKPGSEIWVTFNPDQDTDPTYVRFVKNPPAGRCKSVQVSWRDNPALPDVLKDELEDLRRTDPEAYAHIWEGGTWSRSDAQVFNGKWVIDDFVPDLKTGEWQGPYFGVDWGFATDPLALVKSWVHEGKDAQGKAYQDLHIEYEAYKVGCEIRDTPALFEHVPDSRRYLIRADNARPEMISHMKLAGFHIESANKWPGSVEDGITVMRSFRRIVIHPRCRDTIQEFRLYSYKTDKLTGEVLPDIVDKHNHGIDAIRYSLDKLVRPRTSVRRGAVLSPSRWR